MEYVASISLLLGDLKLEDHIIDNKHRFFIWKIIKTLFSKDFKKAKYQLVRRGVPVDQIWCLFLKQMEREGNAPATVVPQEKLHFYSEATAELTGLVFKCGAAQIDALHLQEKMYDLGYRFGRLAYLLDALEDFDRDLKNDQFNAVQAAYGTQELTVALESALKRQIIAVAHEVREELLSLPLNNLIAEGLGYRVVENIAHRLNADPVSTPLTKQVGWREKLKKAMESSYIIFRKRSPNTTAFGKLKLYLATPFMFLFFAMTPYRVWAQVGSDSNGENVVWVCICIAIALCGGKEYVVEKDCCGNTVVREKGPCDC